MEEVLERDPDNADALNFIGYTFVENNHDLARAEKMLARAVELRPLDGYVADSYGWLLFKRGRYREALEWLQKAFQLVPDEPVVAEHVGDCHLKIKSKAKAIELYRRALELYPEADQKERLVRKVKDLE